MTDHFYFLYIQNLAERSFQFQYKKIIAKRALILGSGYNKAFRAWNMYIKNEKRINEMTMRMMYWKVARCIKYLKKASERSIFLQEILANIKKKKRKKLIKKILFMWLNFVKYQVKIRKFCQHQTNIKSLKLGFCIFSSFWYRHKQRQVLKQWYSQIKIEEVISWMANQKSFIALNNTFYSWKYYSVVMKEYDKSKNSSQIQQTWLSNIIDNMKKESNEIKSKRSIHQKNDLNDNKDKNLNCQALNRRINYIEINERNILQIQRKQRRKRVNDRMTDMYNGWEKEKCRRVKEINDKILQWITSKDASYILLKKRKDFERKFFKLPKKMNSLREKTLSSPIDILFSILDGKMSAKQVVPHEYLSNLPFQAKNTKIAEFELLLKKDFGISLNVSLKEIILKEGRSDGIYEYLKKVFSTFNGSQWKCYISPAHHVMMAHDCFTDKV